MAKGRGGNRRGHGHGGRAESKQIKAEHRRRSRNKQGRADNENDEDVSALVAQLFPLGLALREVPGDGNCLFRALSDQLYGEDARHAKIRTDVVDYIRSNREDFEPFLVDETSFERHLQNLGDLGTYGANDSIVAFSRIRGVTIVIHQLDEPMWRVDGEGRRAGQRELHISYHNGNHYNSVRRIGEEKDVRMPANIRINLPGGGATAHPLPGAQDLEARRHNEEFFTEDPSEDDENLTDLERDIRQVMRDSDTDDMVIAKSALESNALCVEATVDYLLQLKSLETLPPIWEPDGTASRILGEEAALEAAKQTPKRDAAARRADIQKKLQQSGSHLTNKKRKQLKKADRKLANEERKRCDQPKDHRDHSGDEGVEINAPPNMQSLSI